MGDSGGKESRRDKAWKAPRILKEPVRWRGSDFRKRERLGEERGEREDGGEEEEG